MTPSIERTSVTNHKVGIKGQQSQTMSNDTQNNYIPAGQHSEQYPGSSGMNYP